jgi:sporulation protein YlmC with PRC-barrel domain
MRLAADVLDKQIVDRNGHPCGKVDGIVLAVGDGPARVVALEVGVVTAAARLGPRVARVVRRLVRRLCGGLVCETYRIPRRRVTRIGKDVHVDLDATRARLTRAERWLRDHVVRRIPGA